MNVHRRGRLWPVLLLALLAVAVIGARASGPPDTYKYAQPWQIGATLSMMETGEWFWPHDQNGAPLHKPPFYAWLCAAGLKVTGATNDFTFRLPSILTGLITAAMVYVLGARWYGRRAGVLAAALWLTAMGTGELLYRATTDMLLTMWMTVSIVCADRLLFRRTRRTWPWAVGFWAGMILAAWAKGWGIASVPLMVLWIALATAGRGGFGALKRAEGPAAKAGLLIRLLGRRWWRAAGRLKLVWGAAAFVIVLGALVWGSWSAGGEEFEEIFHFEVIQRFFGGSSVTTPVSPTVPAYLQWPYSMFPASVMAIAGLCLVRPRRWLSRRSPISVPLCWLVAVVLPYSLSHGFRAEYLLPAHLAVALMGAWAVDQIARRGAGGGAMVRLWRHGIAALPVATGLGVTVYSALYLWADALPDSMALPSPYLPVGWLAPALVGMIALGLLIAMGGVLASLRWRVHAVAFLACVGMSAGMFLYVHLGSEAAETGAGRKMRSFAADVGAVIGDAPYATAGMQKMLTPLYLGRLGQTLDGSGGPNRLAPPRRWAESDITYLVTSDLGLVRLGAATRNEKGVYRHEVLYESTRYDTYPGQLGRVLLASPPIEEPNAGRLYLIERHPPGGAAP